MPGLDQWQVLAMGIAMGTGWYLKNKTEFKNQAIPIITFAIQFLQQVVTASGVAEASMSMTPIVAFSLANFLGPAINAFLQTLMVTGLHSGTKALASIRK